MMLPVFASSSLFSVRPSPPPTGEMDAEEGEVNVRDMDHADRVISLLCCACQPVERRPAACNSN
jgi:hypothetical protein